MKIKLSYVVYRSTRCVLSAPVIECWDRKQEKWVRVDEKCPLHPVSAKQAREVVIADQARTAKWYYWLVDVGQLTYELAQLN